MLRKVCRIGMVKGGYFLNALVFLLLRFQLLAGGNGVLEVWEEVSTCIVRRERKRGGEVNTCLEFLVLLSESLKTLLLFCHSWRREMGIWRLRQVDDLSQCLLSAREDNTWIKRSQILSVTEEVSWNSGVEGCLLLNIKTHRFPLSSIKLLRWCLAQSRGTKTPPSSSDNPDFKIPLHKFMNTLKIYTRREREYRARREPSFGFGLIIFVFIINLTAPPWNPFVGQGYFDIPPNPIATYLDLTTFKSNITTGVLRE